MALEFNHTLSASIFGEQVKKAIFEKVDSWAYSGKNFKTIAVGLAAFPTGIALACVTLATKVATVGEVAFKGISNVVVGTLGIEGFNAKLGVKQLCIALPASIIDLVFGAPIHMAYNVIGDTVGIAAWSISATIRKTFGEEVIRKVTYIADRQVYHERKIAELAVTVSANFKQDVEAYTTEIETSGTTNENPSAAEFLRFVKDAAHAALRIANLTLNSFIYA